MQDEHTNVTLVYGGEVAEKAWKIADELGIPPDADCVAFDLRNDPFGRKWPDHHFEMFGMVVPVPCGRPSWPWLIYRPDSGAQGFAVQIWRQRISYGEPPIVGELRWHPQTGLSALSISGINPPYSPGLVAPVLKAVRALERVTRRTGRPEGIRKFPPAWFRQELLRAFRVVDTGAIAEPTAGAVHSEMQSHTVDGPLPYRTFRARLNGEKGLWPGKGWPEIRDDLEAIALRGD